MPGSLAWMFQRRGPVYAAVALQFSLMGLYVAGFKGDISCLVCAGWHDVGRPPLEAVSVGLSAEGYDGKSYYAIARNPWAQHHWVGKDDPARRQVRILYPAICWLLSGGDPYLLLWVMPAVNLAAIGGLAWLGVLVATAHGGNPWWGFVLPLAVNAGLAAMRNLTDPVSTLAAFGLLGGWLLGWRWWVLVLWAGAAVFSREQNLAVVLIVCGAAVWSWRPRLAAGLAFVVVVWITWVGVLWFVYDCWPFKSGEGLFGRPLAGLISGWTHLAGSSWSGISVWQIGLGLTQLVLEILVAVGFIAARGEAAVRGTLLGGVGLTILGGSALYDDIFGYARLFIWLPMGIWLLSIRRQLRWPMLLFLPSLLWPCAEILRSWHGY